MPKPWSGEMSPPSPSPASSYSVTISQNTTVGKEVGSVGSIGSDVVNIAEDSSMMQ